MSDRIDFDDKGNLDDVVIEDVSLFHMEWMSKKTVWMRCYKKTGDGYEKDVVFWLRVKKGKIVGRRGDP